MRLVRKTGRGVGREGIRGILPPSDPREQGGGGEGGPRGVGGLTSGRRGHSGTSASSPLGVSPVIHTWRHTFCG